MLTFATQEKEDYRLKVTQLEFEQSESNTATKLKLQMLKKENDQLFNKLLQLKTNAKHLQKLHLLGTGRYGKTHVTTFENRVHALKVVHKEYIDPSQTTADIVADIKKNLTVLSDIQNPNLVELFGVFEAENKPVFITELKQMNLFTYIMEKDGSLPLDLQVSLCMDMSRGLEALHKHSLVHGNLHDRNVLIQNDQAMISDFYYSLLEIKKDHSSNAKRLFPYAAPELLYDQSSPSFSSDVFSLGALTLQIATSTAPMEGLQKSLADLLNDHILLQLINQCLNEDNKTRPSVAKICKEIKIAEQSAILTLQVSDAYTVHNYCHMFRWLSASQSTPIY